MEQLLANLPFALLFLLCPLMMLFMRHGGDHGGHADMHAHHHGDPSAGTEQKLPASDARGTWPHDS